MKKLLLLAVLLVGFVASLQAQTTLDPNAFVNDQIKKAGVYLVEAGKAYAFDGRLDIQWDVTIQGPQVSWIMKATNPPVLVNTPAADGTARQFFEVQAGGKLTLKNLIIGGLHSNGAIVGTFINNVAGSGVIADNVAFVDWQDFGILNNTKKCELSVTNCVFLNGVRLSYSPWGGFPMRMNVAGSTVTFENNTVVNSGRLLCNSGPFFNAKIYECHNSFLNFTKAGEEQRAFEFITANNIFYNYDFCGRKYTNNTYDSYFTTWNYYADARGKLDSTSLYLGQNLFYRSPEILTWFAAQGDTILPGLLWEHADVDSFVLKDTNYRIGTNYSGFNPGWTVDPGNLAKQLQFLDEYWYPAHRGANWPDWRVASGVTWDAGTGLPVVKWPPAFNLSYTNTYLQKAATDGLPVGDLNWWPTQKATYMANRAQYIAALRDSIKSAKALYKPGKPTPLITPSGTAVKNNHAGQPVEFSLGQNYPNPFNPTTTIEYSIGQTGRVTVELFNMMGQKVNTLVNENQASGSYKLTVDGRDLPSGVYFYSIRTAGMSQTKKMILMK
jgi:hypothetical protein